MSTSGDNPAYRCNTALAFVTLPVCKEIAIYRTPVPAYFKIKIYVSNSLARSSRNFLKILAIIEIKFRERMNVLSLHDPCPRSLNYHLRNAGHAG
jgi:hypothetical protein